MKTIHPEMEESISSDSYARLKQLLENSTSVSANPYFIQQPTEAETDGECLEYHTKVDGVTIKVRLTRVENGKEPDDHFVEVVAALGSSFGQLDAALPALASVNAFLGMHEFAGPRTSSSPAGA